MGLTHTPRVIATVARGLWHHRIHGKQAKVSSPTGPAGTGFSAQDPFVYTGRVGLLDVDYLGHLNNAAYLQHAELARWLWTASRGYLLTMLGDNCHFLLASSSIRYRREIRPVFQTFQIDTFVAGIDERNVYAVQNFRYPPSISEKKEERISAQMILRGVLTKHREVVNPMEYFERRCSIDREILEQLRVPSSSPASFDRDGSTVSSHQVLQRYIDLEESLKEVASLDDDILEKRKEQHQK
jgi:acyl-CoA thioesterase FadM